MRLYKTDGNRTFVERDGQWALSLHKGSVQLTGIWYQDDGWMYYTTDEPDHMMDRVNAFVEYDNWDEGPTLVIDAQPMHELVYGVA